MGAPWTPGATYPVIYTATKTNQSLISTFGLKSHRRGRQRDRLWGGGGPDHWLECPPRHGQADDCHVNRRIPRAENMITIANGTPGLTNLRITVNGTEFQVDGLKGGEVRELDVASAMLPGDNNTIAFTGLGKPEGAAWVLVHD